MIDRLLGSWDKIDKMHETIMSNEWRNQLKDDFGNLMYFLGIVWTMFILKITQDLRQWDFMQYLNTIKI